MASNSDLSAKSTHDLWVEARQFRLDISRPTPTTIELTVTRPTSLDTVDGAVITFHHTPISGVNNPVDGTQYTPSTDFAAPADRITGQNGAHVVGFYSSILALPMPSTIVDSAKGTTSFTITITNTVANQLYYASIHPATNVLQYYPIGIQSYPLEGSRIEKDSTNYTGNIPSFPEAPLAPQPGMVYFDQQLNVVQYWTGTEWISTRSESIPTGPVHPGVAGQTYVLLGSQLIIFDGAKWRYATPTNFQVRVGVTWVPFTKLSSVTELPKNQAVGDWVWDFTVQRASYWDGADWINPNATNTLFNRGTGTLPDLIPACTSPVYFDQIRLPDPRVGQLFYNTSTKTLDAWTGTEWIQANTDQGGTPSTDKVAIGTDGSYDERVRLMKVLKSQLGWPQNCVELTEEQLNIGIDNALDNYRTWVDAAYKMKYVMFTVNPGQQVYYLNSAVDGTDRIVDVSKIHRLNVLGIEQANGNDAIWSSGILTSYYSAATVDILSLHLLSSLAEEFKRIFAGDFTFLWDEPSRELTITRRIRNEEKVIIECMMERTEQEILVDRWAKQFIQNWALAENKYQLGMIRSRFSSGTPGAGGAITQNGEMLISEARQDMAELKQSALDYEWGGHVGFGNVSFLIG